MLFCRFLYITPPSTTAHAPAITPNAIPAFCPLLLPPEAESLKFELFEILFSLSASAAGWSKAGAGEGELKGEGVGEKGAGGDWYTGNGKGEGEGECWGGSEADKVDGRKRIEKNRKSEMLQRATVLISRTVAYTVESNNRERNV